MKQLKYFFLILFLIITGPLMANSNTSYLFNVGVEKYQQGQFKEALKQFEQLIEIQDSAIVFYNLGNCYVKLEQYPKAVAAYYSALKRDPSNPNTKHNLNHAKDMLDDPIDFEDAGQGIVDIHKNLVLKLSFRQHLFFWMVVYMLFFLVFALRKGFGFFPSHTWLWPTLVFLLVLQSSSVWVSYRHFKNVYGIIQENQTVVRYGPSKAETKAFEVMAGTRFQVLDNQNGWANIRFPDGKTGWLETSAYLAVL